MATLSNALGLAGLGLSCAQSAYNMWNGSNQWSGWVAYLAFFRHVAKLAIDYTKFDSYEQLCLHSGPRIMHEKFCMISDRPRKLTVDERNRPHCSTGPFCEWGDGAALYALHGVRVPMWVVETPTEKITKEMIFAEKNTDVRRELFRRIGMEKLISILDYKKLDEYRGCELISFDLGDGRERPYVFMRCPTTKQVYIEGAPPDCTTAKAAYEYQHRIQPNEEIETIWER